MPEADSAAGRRAALAPGTRTLLTLAAAVIVLAGFWLVRDILAPVLVAATLVIIVHPVRKPLERRGWPRWSATLAVIVIAYLVLAIMMGLILLATARFAAILPTYSADLAATGQQISGVLTDLGFSTQTAADTIAFLSPATLVKIAAGVASFIVDWVISFFLVLAYVLFMAADASRYANADRLFGTARVDILERIRRFASGTRRSFIVNAIFGAIVAVLDGLALWVVEVPAPFVWAVLAFVTNFVPNIGFVLGLIPPALLALAVGGWPLFLIVVAIYCVINLVMQEFVQPRFVADAVSLSFTITFFSVIFWTFVVGPVGAILAVPLTLLVRALLLEGDAESDWLRWLSGDRDTQAS